MKRFSLFSFLCFFFCVQLLAQQPDQESMMKAWQEYMTPGDIHKMIAKSDGVWNTEVTMWMDPNSKPMTNKGTCVNKMILGGRYQESKYKGSFMNQPMEGVGTLAYDNAKKEFQSTWVDNMGTGIMMLTGTWDDASKTLNLSGDQTDPMTGKTCKIRETLKMVDNNNQVMEMYVTPDGGSEFKTMEIKFKRK